MKKQVIHLFGASGSGTTTLGKLIARRFGYFFMDTDDYFWQPTDPPYAEPRAPADRIALMREDIAKQGNVVLAGSLSGWGDPLIPLFTLAIRLETDTDTRLERLKQRERANFGSRIEPGGDMAENHQNFIAWAAAYDRGGLDMRSKARPMAAAAALPQNLPGRQPALGRKFSDCTK